MLRQRNPLIRKGGLAAMQARLFCFLLLVSVSVSAISTTDSQTIERYQRLAASGAPQLALEGLREGCPDLEFDPTGWANWQRAELRILAGQQRWQQLLEQIESYPEAAPAQFITELQKVRIEALIEINRFREARQLLVKQIWSERDQGASDSEQKLKMWRELVVKSYISEGLSDDAYIAMQYFRQDYGTEDESSTELLIQTLLASRFPKIAEGVIDKLPDSEKKRLFKQIARLRQNRGVRSILFSSREKLQQKALSPFQRAMLWGMVAEAAELRTDNALRVIALENFLSQRRSNKEVHGGTKFEGAGMRRNDIDALFNLDAQQLWAAYDSYALSIANREQLLLGDDDAWIESGQKAGKMHPVHQRSIYAFLARHAVSEQGRIAAQDLLVASLKKLKEGDDLITILCADNEEVDKRYDSELGQQVLSVLLDNALRARDLERASELISHMDSPEVGNGHFVWSLRKAKIFLLASNYVQSIEVIGRLVDELPNASDKSRDRLLQLIFDLQTAHQDIAAVRLLKKIDSQSSDPKLHRELLYWIADSNMALDNYRLAAQGYLESAIVPGINTMDPWAQTARYQAAKALLKAELKGDAMVIYRQLLKHTQNSSRRALLKQELEQIHLY